MRNSSSLDALFSRPIQQILAAVLVERDAPWYLSDLADRLDRTPSTLQRPLGALVASGILRRTTDGNRVYYAADSDCPILPELRGMLLKTVALVDVLAAELRPLAARISTAFVYGSLARSEETSQSDIDLLAVGEVTLADLAPILKKAEKQLSRPVSATIYSPSEFRNKLSQGNHFLRSVLSKEKLFVIGTQDDLEGLSTQGTPRRPQNKQGGDRRSARRRGAES